MQAFVSLWSADLLDLGRAVDELEELADGFHIDVFDGHNVPELLFGPDLVTALRRRTSRVIDVHLNVTDPDFWIDRFADAGADVITVQSGATRDVDATLGRIRGHGCGAGLGVEVHESPLTAVPHLDDLSRVLLMGTEIGVKGKDLDRRTPARLAELVSARGSTESSVSLIVDGGIRRHTVRALAAAGADGVIPGSLVFSSPDPRQALSELKAIPTGRDLDGRAEDGTARVESH
jgi:ribulose-phosphate 3-epimerase